MAAVAVLAVACSALVVVPAVRSRVWNAESGPKSNALVLRYPFERSSRGSVLRALQAEIAFYQERIRRDPQGGLDLAFLAGTYLKMARATGDLSWYLLAEQAARRSLANLPFHNEGALLALARVAEARHDFADALRLAARAAGDDGALAILVTANLATGEVDAADRAAEALLKRAPSLGAYTMHALVHVARGRDEAAMTDLRRGIALEEPGEAGASALARTRLGRIHAKHGELAAAEALYIEALRILPQYPLALIYLSELETRTRRYAQAEEHLREVVTITAASPNVFDHAVLRGLGRLRLLEGDLAGSEALWGEAQARLRQDVASGAYGHQAGTFGHRREMARLLLERGRPEDIPEALALMKAEIEVRRDADTLDTYAWALSAAGRYQAAADAMAEALRWGSREAGLLYRAGKIHEALGQGRAARRFFNGARRTDPSFDDHAWRASGFGD